MKLPDQNDTELNNALDEAYRLAAPYRTNVQYRKDCLCHPNTYIGDNYIFNYVTFGLMIAADCNFVGDFIDV